MSRHRDRRGRFTRRSSRRPSRRRATRSTSHASAPTSSSRGGFMGISPMIWIVLAGGAAVLWWSSRSKPAVPQIPALPQAPSGSALAIPQLSPTPISASPQQSEIVPSGSVPGSIWV